MAPKNDGQSRRRGGTAREGDHPPCTKPKRRKGGDTLAVVVRPCCPGDGVRHRPPSINAGVVLADGRDRPAASGHMFGSNAATGITRTSGCPRHAPSPVMQRHDAPDPCAVSCPAMRRARSRKSSCGPLSASISPQPRRADARPGPPDAASQPASQPASEVTARGHTASPGR